MRWSQGLRIWREGSSVALMLGMRARGWDGGRTRLAEDPAGMQAV